MIRLQPNISVSLYFFLIHQFLRPHGFVDIDVKIRSRPRPSVATRRSKGRTDSLLSLQILPHFVLLVRTFGPHKYRQTLTFLLLSDWHAPPPHNQLGRGPQLHSGNASCSVSDGRERSTVSSSPAHGQRASSRCFPPTPQPPFVFHFEVFLILSSLLPLLFAFFICPAQTPSICCSWEPSVHADNFCSVAALAFSLVGSDKSPFCPLWSQTHWGGYTLCFYSVCLIEVSSSVLKQTNRVKNLTNKRSFPLKGYSECYNHTSTHACHTIFHFSETVPLSVSQLARGGISVTEWFLKHAACWERFWMQPRKSLQGAERLQRLDSQARRRESEVCTLLSP